MPKFTFLHKSHKPQQIAAAPGWTDLRFVLRGMARKRFYCDADGILESTLYLPLSFTMTGEGTALVRVRLVREPFRTRTGEDGFNPTGYDERPLVAEADGFARVRFLYKGLAQRRRRYFWQAQVVGPASASATGTHYAEFWRHS